jgi:hypothetical protein
MVNYFVGELIIQRNERAMRYLNGFVLIGFVLLLISIGGVASGNRLLTEPGQQPNQYAWLEYLGAAALMLINGGISIYLAARNRPAEVVKPTASDTQAPEDTVSTETAQ